MIHFPPSDTPSDSLCDSSLTCSMELFLYTANTLIQLPLTANRIGYSLSTHVMIHVPELWTSPSYVRYQVDLQELSFTLRL